MESIRTKSGYDPRDITVSKSGHLVYSDFDKRTVNIVMNKQISEVIRLRTWRPLRVNSTVSCDLLVTMVGDKKYGQYGRALHIFNRESNLSI